MIKKIERISGVSVYDKVLCSEHPKKYFKSYELFCQNVLCQRVSAWVRLLPNFVYYLAQKPKKVSKRNFILIIFCLKLDYEFEEYGLIIGTLSNLVKFCTLRELS